MAASAMVLSLAAPQAALAQFETTPPGFSKTFSPPTIGPGSVSELTFTINNSDSPDAGASSLAFTDNLPAGVTLASPAFVSNTCDGTVTAPNGGTAIALVDGKVVFDQKGRRVNVVAGA